MHLNTNREPYQIITLCILAALAVIFAVWTAVSRADEGVLFCETLLEVNQQGDTTVYSGTVYGTPVTITCREENGTKYVNFSADGAYYANCRVEYPEGKIKTEFGEYVDRIKIIRNDEVLFSGGYDPSPTVNAHAKYFNDDGTWNMDTMISIRAYTGAYPWQNFEFDLSDILRFSNNPETSVRGSWAMYLLALFASVLFGLLTAFPDEVHYLSHFLDVRDPEPTEFYYFTHKISSAGSVLLIFILYIKGITTII